MMAQTDSSQVKKASSASLKLGLFGISDLNYFGRTDSRHSSGFFPLLEIWADKHLYISAAPVFIHNNYVSAEYAGTVSSLGYMFRNKKWGSNNFISVPVYKQGTGLVQSRMKFQLYSSFSRLTKIVNITLSGDIKYSDRSDYGASAGLDHVFRFPLKNKWVFAAVPTAFVNGGTQHFTGSTVKNSGFLILPPLQQKLDQQVNRFSVLSYEFSAPLLLAKGKIQFLLNPAYVVPQNLVTVEGHPELSETGKPMVYLTAGIKYKAF